VTVLLICSMAPGETIKEVSDRIIPE